MWGCGNAPTSRGGCARLGHCPLSGYPPVALAHFDVGSGPHRAGAQHHHGLGKPMTRRCQPWTERHRNGGAVHARPHRGKHRVVSDQEPPCPGGPATKCLSDHPNLPWGHVPGFPAPWRHCVQAHGDEVRRRNDRMQAAVMNCSNRRVGQSRRSGRLNKGRS
jgi:hypothetical protein